MRVRPDRDGARAYVVAAVITGVVAAAVGSSFGWGWGRVAFLVGAAVTAIALGFRQAR